MHDNKLESLAVSESEQKTNDLRSNVMFLETDESVVLPESLIV